MSEIKTIKINGEEYEVCPSWASVNDGTLRICQDNVQIDCGSRDVKIGTDESCLTVGTNRMSYGEVVNVQNKYSGDVAFLYSKTINIGTAGGTVNIGEGSRTSLSKVYIGNHTEQWTRIDIDETSITIGTTGTGLSAPTLSLNGITWSYDHTSGELTLTDWEGKSAKITLT